LAGGNVVIARFTSGRGGDDGTGIAGSVKNVGKGAHIISGCVIPSPCGAISGLVMVTMDDGSRHEVGTIRNRSICCRPNDASSRDKPGKRKVTRVFPGEDVDSLLGGRAIPGLVSGDAESFEIDCGCSPFEIPDLFKNPGGKVVQRVSSPKRPIADQDVAVSVLFVERVQSPGGRRKPAEEQEKGDDYISGVTHI